MIAVILIGGLAMMLLAVFIGRTILENTRDLQREIDDRRRAEEALRQSREDLDRAQEVGQIGSWRLDVRRNVLTWSDENHRIFGVPKGTPLTYETFLGIVHPDDRQYVDTQWKAGLRGAPYDIEHRIVVDGQVKWVREKAYLEFDDAGELLGGFGITQDITERKRAEAGTARKGGAPQGLARREGSAAEGNPSSREEQHAGHFQPGGLAGRRIAGCRHARRPPGRDPPGALDGPGPREAVPIGRPGPGGVCRIRAKPAELPLAGPRDRGVRRPADTWTWSRCRSR